MRVWLYLLLLPRELFAFFLLLLGRHKSDGPFRRFRVGGKFAQRIEKLAQLNARVTTKGVMLHRDQLGFFLQRIEAFGQVCVTASQFAQLHKRPHHIDRYVHRTRAAQQGRGHDRAVFRERQRQLAPATPA
ncbi:hypothetical protein [Variovorax sp. LjRoot178]